MCLESAILSSHEDMREPPEKLTTLIDSRCDIFSNAHTHRGVIKVTSLRVYDTIYENEC